jgi:eukaryotic-like serine/threonine-protein kinase
MDLRAQLQAHLGAPFILERELGGGGMSRVFVANEVRLSRKVVVKVLSPELAQGLNAERFEREILLAASLQQANIVPLLAAGDIDGLPYFTMPFVDGESLRTRLGGSGLPIADVVAILRDVTKALAYAHARNIVHRDIKPDNVLLSGGTAVVTDFGIAKALSASRTAGAGATLTSVGTSIGTPAYMAPEQVAGDPNLDHRVDLYALGCMAYELLTGRSPFSDRTPQKMLAAHLSETAIPITSLRPDCPAPLATLVTQLLQKDPADRPGSANDVLRALDAVTTTSSPTLALGAPGMLPKVLGLYLVAVAAVAILAKAAVVGIGLPDWVFPGAVAVMLLGLPALLITAYIKGVARHAVSATPTLTPNGSMVPKAPSGTMATMALRANPHVSWRRTARGGMFAMGAFVLVVAGFMLLRSSGIGPWGSLVAAGKLSAQDQIVLADFSAAPDDSALASIVAEAVRAAMTQSQAVHLVPQTVIAGALEEMKRPRDSRLSDPAVVTQVAARTGAKAVLGGRLARAGSGYAVSLELSAAQGGLVLASYQATASQNDLLEVVDGLTRKLRSKVGESLKQVQRSIPLARATTTSLEALRKYSDAVVANDIDQDFTRAIRDAREAVALDSTFALAWRKLGVALFNSGGSVAAQDSAINKAAAYADRLPDREKYLLLGFYYENGSTAADQGKALAAYQNAYLADSTSTTATNQLAVLFDYRHQPDSSIRYFRRQLILSPDGATVGKLARELAIKGDSVPAWALLDSAVKASPGAPSLALVYARLVRMVARGQFDSLVAATTRMTTEPDPTARLVGYRVLRSTAMERGQLARVAAADSGLSVLAATGHLAPEFSLATALTDILFRGDPERGLQRLEAIVTSAEWNATSPGDRNYPKVVELFARAGKPDRARAMLAAWQASDIYAKTADARAQIAGLEGEIALAEGKHDEAIRQFRASASSADGILVACLSCVWFDLARAFDAAGQADSATAYFERYLAITPAERGFGPNSSDNIALATVEKRLGEIYDSRKDKSKALAHYGAFADLWKAADPELQPTVVTVRKRMAELVAGEGK